MRTLDVAHQDDAPLGALARAHGLNLTPHELREVCRLLDRDPTLTELHIFNTECSEHCSYKSSRSTLALLPTSAPNVIQGPQEDAGIIFLTEFEGERYGLVIGHESHNHPSQVVPYEGAATGVGGIIRDVLCMGAHVVAVADSLRFGDPTGPRGRNVRYIAGSVVSGVGGYGNAVGIPNIAGEVYWNASFDTNCLVNVVALGVVKESEIIHSRAPRPQAGDDVVLVGKATDNSGFGGAAFSSGVLGDDAAIDNRGAVQVPDPFLKSVLIRATEAVFAEVRRTRIPVGFKDLGAGGVMCASSELGDSGGVGIEIDLALVHVALPDLSPHIIACAETQERMLWIVPPAFTPRLLEIYNRDFDLGGVAEGAGASVIGTTTADGRFTLRFGDEYVCDAPIAAVCRGIRYERVAHPRSPCASVEPPPSSADWGQALLSVLAQPNVASRAAIYHRYDQEVQGNTCIRPGEGDAGVIVPVAGSTVGVALSLDCNPVYCRIDPYQGAAMAVAEAARNVAAVGATPAALTDCLNMGNPESPSAFWAFQESVRGIADAARALGLRDHPGSPLPVVSGNVSFYNDSAEGSPVDPSPIIACVGTIADAAAAVGMQVRHTAAKLYLLGPRGSELGGSVYQQLHGAVGGPLPTLDFAGEKQRLEVVVDAIDQKFIAASHDVSDGGLLTCVAEMLLGADGAGGIGATLDVWRLAGGAGTAPALLGALFGEQGGFVLQAALGKEIALEALMRERGVDAMLLGSTGGTSLRVSYGDVALLDIPLDALRAAWCGGVEEAM